MIHFVAAALNLDQVDEIKKSKNKTLKNTSIQVKMRTKEDKKIIG